MRKTIQIALLFSCILITTQSCKKMKAGCMDTKAENYNKYAKLEDGSCMYHSSTQITLTDANWTLNDPYYLSTITWPSLTKEVIERGSYSVLLFDGVGWVELPFAYSISSSYSSYFQAEISEGKVVISCSDSDLTTPDSPGNVTIKIVAWW